MANLSLALAAAFAASASSAHAEAGAAADLAWLAGEWVGEGREGDGGAVEGSARLYWTPPLEGAISYLFTWSVAETGHTHYALSVFRDTPEGVTGAGIHYGRDFRNFEAAPWKLRLTRSEPGLAIFECTENCRARTITFSMTSKDALEERWAPLKDGDPDWIVAYRRSG